MSMIVTLAWHEYFFAALVGLFREVDNYRTGTEVPLCTDDGDSIMTNIHAAAAELAAAKALNLYWGGVGVKKQPDIGRSTEVRHTPYHTGKLAVLDKDADDRPFVLVRGTPPKLEVVGWMFGKDAKQEHWRDSNKKRKPFMVPSSELVPINNSRIGAEPTPSQAAPEISNNS